MTAYRLAAALIPVALGVLVVYLALHGLSSLEGRMGVTGR